jgi:dihydroneopterin aldolase
MIGNTERLQIKQLIQSPQWATLERLANEICETLKESSVRETEWDTIKATLLQEGQVLGIKKLLQEAYKHAQNV